MHTNYNKQVHEYLFNNPYKWYVFPHEVIEFDQDNPFANIF